jgi:hypothetical protein
MAAVGQGEIYSIRAIDADRWQVFQEPSSEPLASFPDRAAALNYAMCLARGRIAWHLLLRRSGGFHPNADADSRRAHH